MSWLRLTIDTTAEQVEPLVELLERFDACSVSCQPRSSEPVFAEGIRDHPVWWRQTSVSALLSADIDLDILLACIRNRIGTENIHRHYLEPLPDRNWVDAHIQQFPSICIAGRLVIRPEWEPTSAGGLPEVILAPGLAFGTGKHVTTALSLEWLALNDLRGKTVIDYGCGSGILALAAARLGAEFVYAIDIDPQALQATRRNSERNQLQDRIRISKPDGPPPPAQLLIANILFNPLLELAPVFARLVLPGGAIVLSGILANQAQECLAHYQQWFKMVTPVFREEWALLEGCRVAAERLA